ncbi:NAD-dependent epimerase/dehydratase family protein [Pricia sp. S334]|uniref:NAD-dependent epimerase/dehydratase family protein n=1 Tax=Pricia mediterranea TaxID=3076079 RepID=A0ABU3L2X4_9FLAO|nr:NAD-dependent epimerase/dehydratase family protein [Pricia sp. S334]MDT7828089.1 NAD-dependent epimerase/dehydratase family protein [Pricia sp. S334]
MKNIIVTGGCGFLGSNVVKKLNAKGQNNIIIIDNYDERKFKNLTSLNFVDYISYKQGITSLKTVLEHYEISAILHIGANADVLEKDADIMMTANYEHSKMYLDIAQDRDIPLIYASSSAVYGNAPKTEKDQNSENPHNIYAWSKWLFDKHVSANLSSFENKVIGLRLFNIFGLGEFHKDENASLPLRFFTFVRQNGFIDVFNRDIARDYVWVEDVAEVILTILEDKSIVNGIYDLGGDNPVSHLEVADIVASAFVAKGIKPNKETLIKKIPLPKELEHSFQFFTKAEKLLPLIAKQTHGNKEKINLYINELLKMHYDLN